MDLLVGYDSSSSSCSDVEADSEQHPPKQEAQTESYRKNNHLLNKPNNDSESESQQQLLQEQKKKEDELLLLGKHNSNNNRRGKKILSLTSVLPREILDRLMKSDGYNADINADSSSDEHDDSAGCDDEEKNNKKKKKKKKIPENAASQDKKSGGSGGGGLYSSLFSDLKAAPPKGSLSTSSSANNNNNVVRAPSSSKAPLGLGQAFVTSTTSVVSVSRKRSTAQTQVIRDIHNHQEREIEEQEEVVAKGGEEEKEGGGGGEAVTAAALPYKRTTAVSSKVTRINSAPLASAGLSSSSAAALAFSFTGNNVSAPATLDADFPPAFNDDDDYNNNNKSNNKTTKKRSRQALERALRHGKLDAIDDCSGGSAADGGGVATTVLHQAKPIYQPPPDAYANTVSTQDPHQYHGIRVAATAMYDPSTGTAVVGKASSAGRGKNQIHHLMASAANLELQRARQQQFNAGTPQQQGQTHRANAKQKYGW